MKTTPTTPMKLPVPAKSQQVPTFTMEATGTDDVSRSGSVEVFNLLVRLLDGKTLALKLTSPSVRGHALKHRLFEATGIPPIHQRLLTGLRQIHDDSLLSCSQDPSGTFPTVHLLLCLLGGKGGFGSLLRGAATKAGQKKTNNFDACRDMSGRRLRHVNAEKRLEEWKAEEEERRLEKVAEEFLKKKSKVGKKGVGDSAAQKYVDKYREESARCVAGVEESVRDAVMKAGNGKRKPGLNPNATDAKKLKIWMGKRIIGESDGDNSDDDDDIEDKEEIEKLVILSGGRQSDLNKDGKGSSDYVNFGKHGDGSGGVSCKSGSEEEKNMAVQETVELIGSSIEKALCSEQVDEVEPCSEAVPVSADEKDEGLKQDPHEFEIANRVDVATNPQNISLPNNDEIIENSSRLPDPNGFPVSKSSDCEETSSSSSVVALTIDDFISAAEMEYLGLERLQLSLKFRGLNSGGTLQEMAARLFKLKSPYEHPNKVLYESLGWFPKNKLPKKFLARKRKVTEGCSDYVNFGRHGDGSGGASCESGSEEERNIAGQETVELIGSSIEKAFFPARVDEVEPRSKDVDVSPYEEDEVIKQDSHEFEIANRVNEVEPRSKDVDVSPYEEDEVIKQDSHEFEIANRVNVAVDPQNIPGSNNDEIIENSSRLLDTNGFPVSKSSDCEETSTSTLDSVVALTFDDFISAAEMEYLGLERLQLSLKFRGLNSEGTLQEIASRLFKLKSPPPYEHPNKVLFESLGWFPKNKLPKKFLDRKRKGGFMANGADAKKLKICESDEEEEGNKDKNGGGSCESVNNFGKDGSSGGSCESGYPEETTSASTSDSLRPLSIHDFSCAADLECFGMDRLMLELKVRGLKCGGTLKERAARLFLLKSTPLDKIPKKHFAKK